MIADSVLDAMLAAGCTAEQIVAAIKADGLAEVDKVAARRERDRLRKRRERDRKNADNSMPASLVSRGQGVTPRDTAETPSPPPAPSPDKESSPLHPPKEITLFPEPPPTPRVPPAREQALFDRFWAAYPHKVGKADARKAFSKALTRVDVNVMAEALRRYVAKTDDRPWCNPATWLNQDRWNDQPAEASRGSPRRESVVDRRRRELRDEIANEQQNGSQGEASGHPRAPGQQGRLEHY